MHVPHVVSTIDKWPQNNKTVKVKRRNANHKNYRAYDKSTALFNFLKIHEGYPFISLFVCPFIFLSAKT